MTSSTDLDADATPGRQAGRRHLGRYDIATDAARVEALLVPDGRAFALRCVLHWLVWAAAMAGVVLLPGSPASQVAFGFLLGNQLHAFTVLQHDCGHRSAFASASANRWVGRLLAAFVVMPFTTFTELHRWHHGFLGDAHRDPDEWFYARGPARLWLRECLFMPRFVWLSLTRWPMSVEARRSVRIELTANLAGLALLVGGLVHIGRPDIAWAGVALPLAVLGLLINPVSRGFEHLPLAVLPAGDPRRDDLRFNTVTVTSRAIGLAWANINYHVEHHLHPRAACHRLPELHRLLAGRGHLVRRWPLQRMADLRPSPTSRPGPGHHAAAAHAPISEVRS